MKTSLKENIIEIFSSSQDTLGVHQRNAALLKSLLNDNNLEEFWDALQRVLEILLLSESSPYFEKCIKFIGTFCSLLKYVETRNSDENREEMEHPLLKNIMSFLLKASGLKDDNVRIKSCQIISIIMDNIVGTEVSEEFCENLVEILGKRLQDSKTIIRYNAVNALYRLQDPENLEDELMRGMIDLMNSDSFAKVRQICVEKIAPRLDVIHHFLRRIRDTNENVRLSVYQRLSKFAGFLKITEKQQVLHCGFNDASEKIRTYVSMTLIKIWLEFYDNDILAFMKSLRLDADSTDIENTVRLFENVLKAFFQYTSLDSLTSTLILNESRLLPFDKLNWETVSFWRIYIQFLSKKLEYEDELEKIVPELVYFCEYIKDVCTKIPEEVTNEEFVAHQFIIKQLFLITKTYNFGDDMNRKCLKSLISHVLKNVVLSEDVVETIVSNLKYIFNSVEECSEYVCKIISDILYPVDSNESKKVAQELQEIEYQIARLSTKKIQLKAYLEECIAEQKFLEADQIKNKIRELETSIQKVKETTQEKYQEPKDVQKKVDLISTIRCLDIAAGILVSPKLTKLTTHLKSLQVDFIHDLLLNDNNNVRVKAFKCYGLCCVLDKDTALSGIHILSTPIFAYHNHMECDNQTLLICVAAVVDMLLVWGPSLIAAKDKSESSESIDERQEAVFVGGTSLTDVLQGLVDLMDDDDFEIQKTAGVGLCKLVLSNRIISSSLISRLILKWCNPIEEEDSTMKQIIGYVLEKIPVLNDCDDQLIDAILLTIQALYAAPRVSPLADVNIDNIAKFLITLCKLSPNDDDIQSKLALKIITAMTDKPKSKLIGTYSKMLLLLNIPNSTRDSDSEEFMNYFDNLLDNIVDKNALKNIRKLIATFTEKCMDIEYIDNKNNENEMDDIQEEITNNRNVNGMDDIQEAIFESED